MANNNQLPQELNVLLTEANNRSRWYSSQIWQLPFAYIGLTALVISQFAKASGVIPEYLLWAVFSSAVFGLLVCEHMWSVWGGQERAIDLLIYLEELSGVDARHVARRGQIARPMFIATSVATLFYMIWAALLFSKLRSKGGYGVMVEELIKLAPICITFMAAFLLSKSSLKLKVENIAWLPQNTEALMENLSHQKADAVVGSILLFVALIWQMFNLSQPTLIGGFAGIAGQSSLVAFL